MVGITIILIFWVLLILFIHIIPHRRLWPGTWAGFGWRITPASVYKNNWAWVQYEECPNGLMWTFKSDMSTCLSSQNLLIYMSFLTKILSVKPDNYLLICLIHKINYFGILLMSKPTQYLSPISELKKLSIKINNHAN